MLVGDVPWRYECLYIVLMLSMFSSTLPPNLNPEMSFTCDQDVYWFCEKAPDNENIRSYWCR